MVCRPLRTLVVIVCLLFFPPATRSLVTAQTPEKLRVAYTVIAPTQANVWVAKELGFYAKYGLDVDLGRRRRDEQSNSSVLRWRPRAARI